MAGGRGRMTYTSTHYIQKTTRHKSKQQKRKIEILFRDLSACISCLLILGLLLPVRWYEFGYAYKLSEFPNTLA
jgi:hypothetical protein